MVRLRIVGLVVVAVAAGLAGCGSSSTSAPSPPVLPTTRPSPVGPGQLTQDQMDSVLLPASDFPAGLVPAELWTDTSHYYEGMCPYLTRVGAPIPVSFAERQYLSAAGAASSLLYMTAIAQFASAAEAKKAYDDSVSSFSSCRAWQDPSGTMIHYEELSGPLVGKASYYDKSWSTGSSPSYGGASLNGSAIVSSAVIDPSITTTTTAPTQVSTLLRKQVAGYRAAVGD